VLVIGATLIASLVGVWLRPRPVAWIAAALCVLPWIAFVAYYTHVFDTANYYEWRSARATDFLAALIGVSAGVVAGRALPSSRVQALLAASAAALVLLAVAFAKPALTRMPKSWIKDTWRDGVCIQSTPATCGPCAAATVLRHFGVDVNESVLADEAQATTSGTLNWLLVRAIRERGFDAEFRDVASIDDVKPPAIIGVKIGSVGHFLAYLERQSDGRFVIGEPLKGRRVIDAAELARVYAFDHFALEIAPRRP